MKFKVVSKTEFQGIEYFNIVVNNAIPVIVKKEEANIRTSGIREMTDFLNTEEGQKLLQAKYLNVKKALDGVEEVEIFDFGVRVGVNAKSKG